MQRMAALCSIGWIAAALGVAGCSRIDVAPSCPAALAIGQEGTVSGNPITPGAVPTYQWEVIPQSAGRFTDANAASTTFEADLEGEALIRLTASDGLYLAVGECRTLIAPSSTPVVDVAVSLAVDPATVTVGQTARLICTSVGADLAATLTIEQTGGETVTLTTTSEGVALLTPRAAGDLTFDCIGASLNGSVSEPAVLAITVVTESDGDDGGRTPSRGGRR